MRGRLPDAGAIRRTESRPVGVTHTQMVESGAIKPEEVERRPNQSELWDMVVGDGMAYRPQDVPALTQLVFWMDVARNCRANMVASDESTLGTMIGVGPLDEHGKHTRMAPNPYFHQLEVATQQVMRLSEQLGCTPLARARIGITETANQSMQVDIASKIRAAMREGC